MPLNETDKAWIREAIRLAHERHGWGKFTGFVKDWSGAGAAITILVLFFTQWTGYVEFRTRTTDRLDNIEKILTQISRDSTKQALATHSALPIAEFKATLPDLGPAIATANQQNVRVAPSIIADLQEKLVATDSSVPGFWGAAAQFINYRSQTSLPDVQKLLQGDLPRCTDHDPTAMTVQGLPDPHHMRVLPGMYENCRLALDSPEDDAKIDWLLINRFGPGIAFKHCLITYHGGPISLVLAIYNQHVTLEGQTSHAKFVGTINNSSTLKFSECLFQIMLTGAPPDEGQQFTRTVLASRAEMVQLEITPEKS